jgi:ATP-dependent Clp protease adapter protein ClpS
MDFAVYLLQICFGLNPEEAPARMLRIHNAAVAECGSYPREISARKVAEVLALARGCDRPLRCASAALER